MCDFSNRRTAGANSSECIWVDSVVLVTYTETDNRYWYKSSISKVSLLPPAAIP